MAPNKIAHKKTRNSIGQMKSRLCVAHDRCEDGRLRKFEVKLVRTLGECPGKLEPQLAYMSMDKFSKLDSPPAREVLNLGLTSTDRAWSAQSICSLHLQPLMLTCG